jgi:hypothetical protein
MLLVLAGHAGDVARAIADRAHDLVAIVVFAGLGTDSLDQAHSEVVFAEVPQLAFQECEGLRGGALPFETFDEAGP